MAAGATAGCGAGAGVARGSGFGVGAATFSGVSAANGLEKAGVSPGIGRSGIPAAASRGAIGSGAGVVTSTLASTFGGSVKGPTGSSSSPESPSGILEGAATGSEKTGSTLVLLVMLSIAFCRSLSTV